MVAESTRWDLSVYFPSLDSAEFRAAVDAWKDRCAAAERLFAERRIDRRDERVEDGDWIATFETALEALNELKERATLLNAFTASFVDTDSRDTLAAATESELDAQFVRLSKLETRWIAWIGGLDLDALFAASELARSHRFPVEKAHRAAAHQMSPAEESLASELAVTGSTAWAKLHGNFTSQIIVDVETHAGIESLPMSAVRALAYDADEHLRQRAYRAELAAWKSNELPIAAAINGIKGEVLTLCSRRNWDDPIDVALFQANMDRDTLEAMLTAARESFPIFRRYLRAKSRALGGGERLPWWNLFAPLGGEGDAWSWERGCAFVVENFRTFSDKMADFAARSFAENWIDVWPRPGKRDGAYCMGTVPGESRILMNYKTSFGSVSTLAHELGHAYHNLCLRERTPLQRATPATLAETASIFCETIIRRAGVESGSDADRLQILEAALQGYTQVVVDITSRYLFERSVFSGRGGRELSAGELCEAMTEAQLETYGDGLDATALHPYMWAVKPHYYSTFSYYNFPYMFGLLFGTGLYAIYERDPEGFKVRYDDLLSSTGLADASTLAAQFDIDIRTPDFWRASLEVLGRDVQIFEGLVG